MKQPVQVLIVDDQHAARLGLKVLLAFFPEIEIVGEAGDGQQAVQIAIELHPDVVLMDVQMPLMDGLEATAQIKRHCPTVKVVVLTMYPGSRAAALRAGADGFLLKGAGVEEIQAAILGAVAE